jgi:hypothetical protein
VGDGLAVKVEVGVVVDVLVGVSVKPVMPGMMVILSDEDILLAVGVKVPPVLTVGLEVVVIVMTPRLSTPPKLKIPRITTSNVEMIATPATTDRVRRRTFWRDNKSAAGETSTTGDSLAFGSSATGGGGAG